MADAEGMDPRRHPGREREDLPHDLSRTPRVGRRDPGSQSINESFVEGREPDRGTAFEQHVPDARGPERHEGDRETAGGRAEPGVRPGGSHWPADEERRGAWEWVFDGLVAPQHHAGWLATGLSPEVLWARR